MKTFIHRANIAHFKALLAKAGDARERALLEDMLRREERKLAEDEDEPAPPRPAPPSR
jgi:hypothetical protein